MNNIFPVCVLVYIIYKRERYLSCTSVYWSMQARANGHRRCAGDMRPGHGPPKVHARAIEI
jgi:hypothetical protein